MVIEVFKSSPVAASMNVVCRSPRIPGKIRWLSVPLVHHAEALRQGDRMQRSVVYGAHYNAVQSFPSVAAVGLLTHLSFIAKRGSFACV